MTLPRGTALHQDPGLQPERTVMSWDRSLLAMVVAAAMFLRWYGTVGALALAPAVLCGVAALVIHWTQRHRWTSAWRKAAGWAAAANSRFVPSLGPSRVIAELWMRPRRRSRIDPTNYSVTAKPIVDGLVDARIWPDDSSGWVTGPDMRLGPPVRTPHPEAVLLLIWGTPCCRDACCHHHRQEGGEAA